jgi:uncharacterized membrane protein
MLGIIMASLWITTTPDGFLNKVDAIGYAVCHRIPSHSFVVDGRPMPLCARCTGMYLGALYGIICQFIFGKRKGEFSRALLLIFGFLAILFIIDGLNSFASLILEKAPLYPPQNWLRLITGMSIGLLISVLVFPIFTQTAWQTWLPKKAFDRPVSFVILFAGIFLMIIGILSGLSIVLYPLALLSSLGVVVVLTMIYTVVLLMLFKRENRYNNFNELAPILIGGMVLTLVQIGIFDYVRFLLTETWNGLPL